VEAYDQGLWADAIYHGYNTLISGAKAILLDKGISQSTQIAIIKAFDEQYAADFGISGFSDMVLQINKNEPTQQFAEAYLAQAKDFLVKVKGYRELPVNA